MFCPACGTEAAADDRFCQRCGKPLPAPAAAPTGGATDAADASEMPAAAPPGATARSRFEPYPSAPPGATPFTDASGGHPPTWTAAGAVAGPPLAPFGAVLAGWWQRVGAALLDGLIVGIPLGIVLAVVNAGFGTPHVVVTSGGTTITVRSLQGSAHWVLLIAVALLAGAYMTYFNGGGTGQTPGNRAPGIAVRDIETGATIGLGRGVIRWLVRALLYACFVVPGLLNDLFPLWDPRRQTLADKAARSVVIRIR